MPDIRVSTGRITLTVNDEGEQISFNPKDVGFAKRFGEFTQAVMEKQKEYENRENEMKRPPEEADGMEQFAAMKPMIDLTEEFCVWCEAEIDKIFGGDSSRKLFGGDHVPEAYGSFIEQITPFIQEARGQALNKYKKK